MRYSLPSIPIGLRVGVGGGAPSINHDVQQDIVASAPRNDNGGVFQYDFSETIRGQSLYTTGYLNRPPAV